jgi:hypothetical protein
VAGDGDLAPALTLEKKPPVNHGTYDARRTGHDSRAAEVLQVEVWQRLPLEERWRIVFAMIEDGFALVAASIRATHPEYTPEEFRAALRKRFYRD